jgi:hypothetical protein
MFKVEENLRLGVSEQNFEHRWTKLMETEVFKVGRRAFAKADINFPLREKDAIFLSVD